MKRGILRYLFEDKRRTSRELDTRVSGNEDEEAPMSKNLCAIAVAHRIYENEPQDLHLSAFHSGNYRENNGHEDNDDN